MTREEAKKWLNKLYARADITDEYGDMEDTQPYEEAVDMAIQALEQEPCEDCISRANALKAINKMDIPEDMSVFEIKSHIGVEIGTLPPVQSMRPKGHWIIIDDCERFIAKCSECGRIEDSRMINKYPHCHCGAKMEVQE